MPDQPAAENPQDKEKLKRTAQRVLLILIVLALILAVWGVASRLIARSHLKTRSANDSVVTVVTVKAEASGVDDELVLPGSVLAYMEAPIYARTTGYLKMWYTDIGTQVHKGQLLGEIETPEVDKQLAQSRADLETARANSSLAKSTNERWKGLVLKQAVSRQDADEKAGDAAAKSAAQTSAEQNVARLKDLESFKRVVAPFDGVVTARNTDVGALINAGQTPGSELFRVADIHRLRVYAQVPQAYAAAARTGLAAELHFPERPGKAYWAEITGTSNALDPTARTLQAELQLDNTHRDFFPGAYTEVHFKLPSPTKTLRVPSNTILFRADGLQVATVDPSHKIKMKNIVQGRDFGKTIEVLDGIDPQDDIVVNPSDSIEDGLEVRVAPPQQQDAAKKDSAK
ncbi:MAG TPA: efflux RND transporter periplasmic adaptor subunit [Steroidobacteraceae bacterium]